MVSSFVLACSEETRFTVLVTTGLPYPIVDSINIFIGFLTLGDILEILPFEDPLVVLEIDGRTLWETLEASLETWPAQEG